MANNRWLSAMRWGAGSVVCVYDKDPMYLIYQSPQGGKKEGKEQNIRA